MGGAGGGGVKLQFGQCPNIHVFFGVGLP